MQLAYLWGFLVRGYLISITVETPVLLAGLSRRHGLGRRLFAGVWLTACTYPIVVLVLPLALEGRPRWQYLLIAETFAPFAECLLFAAAFHRRHDPGPGAKCQDLITVALANIASFGFGILANYQGWAWAM